MLACVVKGVLIGINLKILTDPFRQSANFRLRPLADIQLEMAADKCACVSADDAVMLASETLSL
jgi:hypothetical protein